jgi:hypothetical protein
VEEEWPQRGMAMAWVLMLSGFGLLFFVAGCSLLLSRAVQDYDSNMPDAEDLPVVDAVRDKV